MTGPMQRILGLVLGLLHVLTAAAVPDLPDVDPFYTPKNDSWKSEDPGYIIDHRPVKLPSVVPGAESPLTAHQLLYVTRNATLHKTTSVTTIVIPANPSPNRVLSYQIAYDAPDINCSPSYGLQAGAGFSAAMWNQVQMTFVFPYLQSYEGPFGKRPILNIPDYEGSNAAFTVGPQSGLHTLDSIQAALNSKHITGILPKARTVMFGYSGGALATEWASELHAHHASNLKIAGAAMGGPPPNITNTYINVNGTQSPLNVWAILGVMRAFPEVDQHMRDDLLPKYQSLFLGPQRRCTKCQLNAPKIEPTANISSWFKSGDEFLYKFKDILETYGVMGQHIQHGKSPNFPLYIYQGTKDNITGPIEDTDKLYEKYCGKGTKVRYLRYLERDHGGTLIEGMPRVCAMYDMDDDDLDMEEMEESRVLDNEPGLKDQTFVHGHSFVPGANDREDL
ncbi:uncharacterized protein KD926_011672 [Aspergillus affinis]|uniref:uncharacterized protein n=1 Tax=Aspergillus affinis TaxID=1070780 RepID=UPI0022FE5A6F|nr:uncharacterized protein KD926_011672 [Aspergillus affinis]KAI9044702.1 hypothetical protein KD926_011672 [Aspergillus affinis]